MGICLSSAQSSNHIWLQSFSLNPFSEIQLKQLSTINSIQHRQQTSIYLVIDGATLQLIWYCTWQKDRNLHQDILDVFHLSMKINLNANNCDSLAQLCNQNRTTSELQYRENGWQWVAASSPPWYRESSPVIQHRDHCHIIQTSGGKVFDNHTLITLRTGSRTDENKKSRDL